MIAIEANLSAKSSKKTLVLFEDDTPDEAKYQYLDENSTSSEHFDTAQFDRWRLQQIAKLSEFKKDYDPAYHPMLSENLLTKSFYDLEIDDTRIINFTVIVFDFEEHQQLKHDVSKFDGPLLFAKIKPDMHWGINMSNLKASLNTLQHRELGGIKPANFRIV